MQPQSLPPAGWMQDPMNPAQWRYWDGQAWTDHVAPGGPQRSGSNGRSVGAALGIAAVVVVGGALAVGALYLIIIVGGFALAGGDGFLMPL